MKEHLLLTRYDPKRVERGEMLKLDDVREILAIPLLGVIPENESVLQASNTGTPVIMDTESIAGQAYKDAVARFLGQETAAPLPGAGQEAGPAASTVRGEGCLR